MSSRDLLMRRTTDTKGNTMFAEQPLVKAAKQGGLVILDGVDRLPSSTLAVLAPLITDRELSLGDGSRLVRSDRYHTLVASLGQKEVDRRNIFEIKPSFRIIGLALPPSDRMGWVSEETASFLAFHIMPSIENQTKVDVLCSL